MSDAPYSLRLGRAILLIAIGVALHLPRPAGIPFPAPAVRPLSLIEARLADGPGEGAHAGITVEHSDVLARPVSELDRNAPSQLRQDLPVGTTGVVLAARKIVPAATTRVVAVDRSDAPRGAAPVSVARQAAPDAVSGSDDSDGPVAPAVDAHVSRPPDPETSTPAAAARISEEILVRQLIDQYTGALERLDVGAAQAVWPTVDGKALKRAFGQLSAQRLTLQSCGITISGSTANARCQGSATYRPRVGTRAAKIASREWRFDLSKENAAWRIVNTFVR